MSSIGGSKRSGRSLEDTVAFKVVESPSIVEDASVLKLHFNSNANPSTLHLLINIFMLSFIIVL